MATGERLFHKRERRRLSGLRTSGEAGRNTVEIGANQLERTPLYVTFLGSSAGQINGLSADTSYTMTDLFFHSIGMGALPVRDRIATRWASKCS